MDSENMNQLSEAIEAKLSGVLPEIGQVLKEYGLLKLEIAFTTNSKTQQTGHCQWTGSGMVCDTSVSCEEVRSNLITS
ncbi:MAG TPA: hypothetical protein V6D50_07370 [Chroococcales cyanobacterium]|jgi:hypothetical protein